jgi:perosamine synthetase
MRIQRTIPPAAAPVAFKDLLCGVAGIFLGRQYQQLLEETLKDYFGVKHVFLVSSGKAAFTLILNALKSLSPEKTQVLIPAYTCFSVPSAIVKAGLDIALCDLSNTSYDLDYGLFEKTINKKTLCVVPNHLFGMPADMDRIKGICGTHGIYVVEDAAQAMGGTYKGRRLGTIGDVGFFSFGRGKNITCGSGGLIITNSDAIASEIEKEYSVLEKPRLLEAFVELFKVVVFAIFIHPSLYWFPSGLPFLRLGETFFYRDFPMQRFSGIKAGLLKNWKKHLEYSNHIRKENAEYFQKAVGLDVCTDFSVPFLRLPLIVDNREMRDSIYILADKKGLGISCMYPTAVNRIDEIRNIFGDKTFPRADNIANGVLTLPTHQYLSKKDRKDISAFLRASVYSARCNRAVSQSTSIPASNVNNQQVYP